MVSSRKNRRKYWKPYTAAQGSNKHIELFSRTPFGVLFLWGDYLRKLTKYKPTKFKAKDSHYDKNAADYAVIFIESLCHTKGTWAGKPFELIDWQEQIIRDLFGTMKPNGYRQFNTAYIEIPKKMGKGKVSL